MDSKIGEVLEKHKQGFNCAQAVACTYCEDLKVDEKESFRAMESFGLGMGSMGTCGAVSAMAYLVGLKMSDANMVSPKTKAKCYRTMKEMTEEFVEKNKSIECKEIKGIETGEILRSCDGCMVDCAEIVERYLFEEEND